jgi:hypothetical protein
MPEAYSRQSPGAKPDHFFSILGYAFVRSATLPANKIKENQQRNRHKYNSVYAKNN